MKNFSKSIAFGLGFILVLLAQNAHAAVVISVGQPGSSNVNVGTAGRVVPIDFFIGQSEGGTDSLFAIVARFTLEAGTFGTPLGEIGLPAPATSRFFGSSNLAFSEIGLDTDPTVDQFFINQDFVAPQSLISGDSQLWFTLNLDTTGVDPGTYSIALQEPGGSFADFVGFIPATNNLSFTVAVPEPGSYAVLAIVGVAAVVFHRRRRSNVAKHVAAA